MKKFMNMLMLSCRKATELIEKNLFIGLNSREKVQLFMHTSMCDACKRYSHQSEELDAIIKNHVDNFTPQQNKPDAEKNTNLKNIIIKSLDE